MYRKTVSFDFHLNTIRTEQVKHKKQTVHICFRNENDPCRVHLYNLCKFLFSTYHVLVVFFLKEKKN